MIYEYDQDERIVKIDDKTVFLTNLENKIFKKIYKEGSITSIKLDDANEILYNGYGTPTAVKSFMTKLSHKLGIEIDLKK